MDTKQRFWIADEFVDTQILKHKLSSKAIVAFMILCRNADSHGNCSWGHKTIAKKTGMSTRTALRALEELRGCNFVSPFSYERLTNGKRGAVKITPVPVSNCQPNGIRNYNMELNSQNRDDDKMTPLEVSPEVHQSRMDKLLARWKKKTTPEMSASHV